MLFQQGHPVDGHAPVHRFAHVVDGQQSHLHGGQRFHLHAGLAPGFGRGFAHHGRFSGQHIEFDRHAGQTNRVAQRDQLTTYQTSVHKPYVGGTRLGQDFLSLL